MFDIVHLLIFFILGFFLPVIVGLEVSAHYKGTKIQKLCISYASGTFFLVALFEILQSINLFMGQSLKILAVTFLILSLFVCARNFVLYMDELVFFVEKTPIKKVIQSTGNETKAMFRSAEKFEYHAIGLFFVLMVGVQIFALVWFRDVQFGDNYFHTAAIVDAVESGKIWRVEPATGIDVYTFYWRHRFGGWDMYLAYLSYVTGITPAVFVYTLEPIMAILWVYSVIVCLGSELFKEKLKIRYFCALMSVLMLFGQYNFVSTNGYLMNLPWAGRGLLYGVCVLWVFYLTLHFFPDWNKKAKNRVERKEIKIAENGTSMLFVANIASVSMSLMSFQIILPMELLIYFVYMIRHKKMFSFFQMILIISPQIFAVGVFLFEKVIGL